MTEFLLKLTTDDLTIIDMGLQEVKLRLSLPLLKKINAQIQEQQTPPVEKPE